MSSIIKKPNKTLDYILTIEAAISKMSFQAIIREEKQVTKS